MANESVGRSAAGLALVSGFLWGWLAIALIMPLASLALSPLLVALVASAIVLIFRVAKRPDAPYVGVGILIGLLVTLFITVLSAAGLYEGHKEILAGVLILLSFHI